MSIISIASFSDYLEKEPDILTTNENKKMRIMSSYLTIH